MILVKARIKLYKNKDGRQTAFTDGYRPLFNFVPEMKTSGLINIIESDNIYPGDQAIVYITFINSDYLGNNFGKGTTFTFSEGTDPIGDGEILEIILINYVRTHILQDS